jgi:hypothetical protein
MGFRVGTASLRGRKGLFTAFFTLKIKELLGAKKRLNMEDFFNAE